MKSQKEILKKIISHFILKWELGIITDEEKYRTTFLNLQLCTLTNKK